MTQILYVGIPWQCIRLHHRESLNGHHYSYSAEFELHMPIGDCLAVFLEELRKRKEYWI